MEKVIEVFLEEYRQLKGEQISRIGFRDNLIYATLGAFGAIVSFAISSEFGYLALLIIPWICLILGWTYLMNDEKISTIGEYIKSNLSPKIISKLSIKEDNVFDWEAFHLVVRGRTRRKITQLIIDIFTFVIPGITSILAYQHLSSVINNYIITLIILEVFFLIYLLVEIIIHARY